MNNLIRINFENERPTVLGRELHEFLEVGTPYHIWFPRMVEYGFTENVDFASFEQKCSEPTGGRPSVDHQLTIDMAKEIAMLQRNGKGKQARQYFIQIENEWNSPERVMARALKMADAKIIEFKNNIQQLETKIQQDKPKVIFADAVSVSHTTILVGELAKLLRQNGVEIGQNRLFEWLRNNGYLIKRKGTDYNMPTQMSMELGLFEVKETSIARSDGSVSISKTSKVTGKGQQYFINKFIGVDKKEA